MPRQSSNSKKYPVLPAIVYLPPFRNTLSTFNGKQLPYSSSQVNFFLVDFMLKNSNYFSHKKQVSTTKKIRQQQKKEKTLSIDRQARLFCLLKELGVRNIYATLLLQIRTRIQNFNYGSQVDLAYRCNFFWRLKSKLTGSHYCQTLPTI